jgi:hypothetical protein
MDTRALIAIVTLALLFAASTFWLFRSEPIDDEAAFVAEFPVTTDGQAREAIVAPGNSSGGRTVPPVPITEADVRELSDGYYKLFDQSEDPGRYDIFYDDLSGGILVTLYEEPLGEVRREAEVALQNGLGLTPQALCDLDIEVITNEYVNRYYAGVRLGLSSCPGSVVLE